MKTITKRKMFWSFIKFCWLILEENVSRRICMWTCPKHSTNFIFRLQLISLYKLEFFDSQVLQDARVKVTESGYIPGQAFPTEQAQLEGDSFFCRPFCTIKRSCDIGFTWKLDEFASEKLRLVGHILNKIIVIWFFKPTPFS